MKTKILHCYAHGTKCHWQAICVDFDIAVQGNSFREVQDLLNNAIKTYVADAMQEEPRVADQLLNRAAPWHVRMQYKLRHVLHTLRANKSTDHLEANYDLPCPA